MKKIISTLLVAFTLVTIFYSGPAKAGSNITTVAFLQDDKNSEEMHIRKDIDKLSKMKIETERLYIDAANLKDKQIFATYLLDKDVTKHLTLSEEPLVFERFQDALRYVSFLYRVHTVTFAIRLKNTDKPIGMIGLTINSDKSVITVSYWLSKGYQKKGYAREAVLKLGKMVFENLKNWGLYISFNCENKNSENLAGRLAQYLIEDNEKGCNCSKGNFTSYKVKWDKYQNYMLNYKEYVISKVPQVA